MPEEPPARSSPYSAAADKLRDTAKWLFTGIVATAGAVLAGTSLTSMGSLDPGWRLGLAVAGLAVGILGLGLLAGAAMKVLTVNLGTPRMIAEDAEFGETRAELDAMFRNSWPKSATGYKSLVDRVSKEFAADPETRDEAFLSAGSGMLREMTAVAGFLVVRGQFRRMLRNMWWQVLLIALGLGLFAWAANPPALAKERPALSLEVR
jgi:hypothetical protein